jgi:hypothetical protein
LLTALVLGFDPSPFKCLVSRGVGALGGGGTGFFSDFKIPTFFSDVDRFLSRALM